MDTSNGANTQQNNNQSQGTNQNTSSKNFLQQTEDFFDTYLHKKAPFQLPVHVKEIIVKFSPWISLLLALINLQAVLTLFRIGSYASNLPFGYHISLGSGYYIGIALSAISCVLYIMAFQGLQKRTISAWRLLFYSSLVSFVGGILGMNLVGAIIGIVINMYFLFQVKEYYK